MGPNIIWILTPTSLTLAVPAYANLHSHQTMSLLWMFVVDKCEDERSDLKDEVNPVTGLTKAIFQTISRNDQGSIKIKQEMDTHPRDGSQASMSQGSASQVIDQDFVVDLVATDGDKAYNTVVKSKLLHYYLADKGGQMQDEWRKVAISVLFGTPLVASKPVVCTYTKGIDDNSLTLNVRQGHAPRPGAEASIPILGSFALAYKPASKKNAMTPFQMLVLSASKLGPSLAETRMVRKQFSAVQDQLQMFLDEKSQAETELFEKFALLLNAKKAKLRALRAGMDVSDSENEDEDEDEDDDADGAPGERFLSAEAFPPPKESLKRPLEQADEVLDNDAELADALEDPETPQRKDSESPEPEAVAIKQESSAHVVSLRAPPSPQAISSGEETE